MKRKVPLIEGIAYAATVFGSIVCVAPLIWLFIEPRPEELPELITLLLFLSTFYSAGGFLYGYQNALDHPMRRRINDVLDRWTRLLVPRVLIGAIVSGACAIFFVLACVGAALTFFMSREPNIRFQRNHPVESCVAAVVLGSSATILLAGLTASAIARLDQPAMELVRISWRGCLVGLFVGLWVSMVVASAAFSVEDWFDWRFRNEEPMWAAVCIGALAGVTTSIFLRLRQRAC